jgi:hypothetical protein
MTKNTTSGIYGEGGTLLYEQLGLTLSTKGIVPHSG